MTAKPTQRLPWWYIGVVIIVAIPSFLLLPEAFRTVRDTGWPGSEHSEWLFPAYVALSAVLALACYPGRKTVAWILISLIILTDIFLLLLF